jgi:hypothetical protein
VVWDESFLSRISALSKNGIDDKDRMVSNRIDAIDGGDDDVDVDGNFG